jgi:hypothetical protein
MNKIYAEITSDVVLCQNAKADQYESAGAPNRRPNDLSPLQGFDQKNIHVVVRPVSENALSFSSYLLCPTLERPSCNLRMT